MAKQPHVAETATPNPWGWMKPTLPNDAVQSLFQNYTGWAANTSRVQNELIRFVQSRLARDIELFTKFGDCKKPEDFIKMQSEFANDWISDYMQENAKIIALWNDGLKSATDAKNPAA